MSGKKVTSLVIFILCFIGFAYWRIPLLLRSSAVITTPPQTLLHTYPSPTGEYSVSVFETPSHERIFGVKAKNEKAYRRFGYTCNARFIKWHDSETMVIDDWFTGQMAIPARNLNLTCRAILAPPIVGNQNNYRIEYQRSIDAHQFK